ncbi:MAG: hemolysin family protein [Thermodesulfobacteriota bacterium]
MDKDSPPELPEQSPLKRILQFIGISKPETADDLEQEIQELLEEGEEHGFITPQEGLMITSILDLKDTVVREIMTPRSEMVCAPEEATTTEVIDLIRTEQFSRIPIYSGSADHITGILHAKDILVACGKAPAPLAKEMITSVPLFVPENEPVSNMLRTFLEKNAHMAIVTDEFGITRGIVTLEDALEEIVGEIADEHDLEEEYIREIGPDTVIADATTDIEEIEKHFDVKLPEGPYDSIGGLVMHQLGRVPQPGTRLAVPPLSISIIAATKRRILSVRIKRKKNLPPA